MNTEYRYVADLTKAVDIPADGITSRALYSDDATRVIIFGFDTGQVLSEHAAAVPAILYIVRGEGTITLGSETRDAEEGAWAYMPAHLPHSIVAHTPLVMLLTMLKATKTAPETGRT